MKKRVKELAFRSGVFIMATIFLIACGNANNNQQDPIEQADTVKEEPVEEKPVETPQTSDILFKDENGKTVSLNSLKGKVVFINFWATWCPPCIHEMPSINKLRQTFKDSDHIEFLMVDVDNKIETSSAFMKENKYDLPVYTPASNIPSEFLGSAIPTTVVLDKNGGLAGRMEGGRDYTDPQIIKALNELIEK